MKKQIFSLLVLATSMVACTGDYTDWSNPQSSEAETLSAKVTAKVAQPANYELKTVETDSIALFNVTTTVDPSITATVDSLHAIITKPKTATDGEATGSAAQQTISVSPTGKVAKADLNTAVCNLYGKGVEKHDVVANLVEYVSSKGVSFHVAVDPAVTFSVTPSSAKYKEFLYYCGSTENWNNVGTESTFKAQRLALTDADKGVYEGYLYCKKDQWSNTFKLFQTNGSWDDALGSADFTTMSGVQDNSGNLEVIGDDNVYYFEINLTDKSITAKGITAERITGQFNSWNSADDSYKMTWDATNYCWTYTGTKPIGPKDGTGWHFAGNGGWDEGKLTGSQTDLKNYGDPLQATGNIIKLYPTRRDNDNIYATVTTESQED